MLIVRSPKEYLDLGNNKIKNACAKLIKITNNSTKKKIIFFPTLMIIAKYTPKDSNALKNNKNFISKNRHENANNGIILSLISPI